MTGDARAGPRIAMVAGEASGDHLGAGLIESLALECPQLRAFGVGGAEMEARGFRSIFPMSEIAVMGPLAIAVRLGSLLARLREAADAVIAAAPDALVIIDCPEFSHRVARRVRRRLMHVPIIDYGAPSVWAWRPGRARAMRAYVDEVMALLPFEPDVFARLGGPPCHYVGHPAVELGPPDAGRIARIRQSIGAGEGPVLAIMPGSRHNELKRLCGPFADAVARLARAGDPPALVMPTLPHLSEHLEREVAGWAIRPHIVCAGPDRRAAMALADAAIVASGTATLELALARTPMVVAYRTEPLIAWLKPFIIKAHSFVLANLVHGGSPIPEFYQGACTGEQLAAAVAPLLRDGDERARQLAALDVIAGNVEGDGEPPSRKAARIVLDAVARRRGRSD